MIPQKSVGNVRGISAPRSIVLINGYSYNFINWTVNLNSNHMADDFTVTFPFQLTGQDIAGGYLTASPLYPSDLFTMSNVLVEIYVGYPNNPSKFTTSDLARIMYGYMDTAELDFSNQSTKGETVVLTGRNMAAPLIDNKSTIKYQNMTSSAIAQMMAKQYGMNCVVQPTYSLVGTYFQNNTTAMNKDVSNWDFLAFLADQEGYDFRVFDNTLYFGQWDYIVGNVLTDGLNYAWGQNIRDLTISRSPHAARDIKVEVHSFDSKTVKHVSAVKTKTRKTSSASTVSSSSNGADIWNTLANLGYSAGAIAGIMGNMMQESSLNPNETGGGLCQWIGSRWTSLVNFCNASNLSPYSVQGQCEFLDGEVNGGGYISKSKINSMTPTDAATYFCNYFERPGIPMLSNRINYANNFYNQFGHLTGGSTAYITSTGNVTTTTGPHNISAIAQYSNGGSSSNSANSYVQRYFFPGLTQEQCQKKAQQILNQLSRAEIDGAMTVAGNEKLTVDRLLNISGIGPVISGNYYVRKASHNFDLTSSDGYRCDITFSNLLLMDDYTGGL